MGRTYQQTLRSSKDRQALLDSQRNWLAQRDAACSSVAGNLTWSCILYATRSRIAELNKTAALSAEQSPAQQLPTPITSIQAQASSPSSTEHATEKSTIDPHDSQKSTVASSNDGSSLFTGSAVLVGLYFTFKIIGRVWRRRYLTKKYGPEEAAQIMAREIWQGMTAEQLTESRGRPAEIGREIIRARTKETWKYGQTGKNRFQNRIYLENGIVIGWKI